MIRYPAGQFILIEGPDLAGKSTLFHELVRILTPKSGHGKRQIFTSEPTGGKHGRDALAATDPTERAKHFTADRREHVSHILKPYLSTARVVSDRGIMSTLAYQGAELVLSGRDQSPEDCMRSLYELQPSDYPEPDLVLLLCGDPEKVAARRDSKRYTYSRELKQRVDGDMALQKAVYENYMILAFMDLIPNIALIEADQGPEDVLAEAIYHISGICPDGDVLRW